VTADDFRRLALSLDGVIEAEHMGHPDFRVGGRIFATLQHGMRTGAVMLSLQEQERFIGEWPKAFSAETGAWGAGGATKVHLAAAGEEAVGEALTVAWQLRQAKNGSTRRKGARSAKSGKAAKTAKKR
jgi:hypothetical protein